mmetsp:Transcript_68558/g.128673  ORF Transcript_68558/g.128673 Transcript_68558/m.128673 type:complete len:128 (-) Transcript_68558:58-441(-)
MATELAVGVLSTESRQRRPFAEWEAERGHGPPDSTLRVATTRTTTRTTATLKTAAATVPKTYLRRRRYVVVMGKKQTNDADFRNEEHNEDSYGAGTRSLKGLVEDEAEEEEDSESEFDDGGEMGDSE